MTSNILANVVPPVRLLAGARALAPEEAPVVGRDEGEPFPSSVVGSGKLKEVSGVIGRNAEPGLGAEVILSRPGR